MIEPPPFETGAVHDTTDEALTADVALTDVGAPGTTEGTAEADVADARLVPAAFVAVTVNV